jgi:hypothetical protein
MIGKMTPSAFNKIIEQDIEWLECNTIESAKNNSLEFDHIINTLRYAANQYGDNGKRIDEITRTVKVLNCYCGAEALIEDDCCELDIIRCSDYCNDEMSIIFASCSTGRKSEAVDQWNAKITKFKKSVTIGE